MEDSATPAVFSSKSAPTAMQNDSNHSNDDHRASTRLDDAVTHYCSESAADASASASTVAAADTIDVDAILSLVPSQLSLVEMVRSPLLGSMLTSPGTQPRRRATQLLAVLLERGALDAARAGDSVRPLITFFCDRLSDYVSIGPCLRALSALLNAVERSPPIFPDAAVAVCKAVFATLHVAAMEQPLRQAVFSLLLAVANSPVHANAVLGRGPSGGALPPSMAISRPRDAPFALDFAVGVVNAVDGEKDPRCLLVCLSLVGRLLSPAPPLCWGDAIASLTEELFGVIACYFPITFTPPPNDPHGITKEALIKSLRRALASSYRLAPFVMPLLLEKLSSSVVEAKRDAKRTLRVCAPVFGPVALAPFLPQLAFTMRNELLHSKDKQHPGAFTLAAMSAPDSSAPSLWTPQRGGVGINSAGAAAYDSWMIGITAGAIGLNFTGKSAGHANSGYGLYVPQPSVDNPLDDNTRVEDAEAASLVSTASPISNMAYDGGLTSPTAGGLRIRAPKPASAAGGKPAAAAASSGSTDERPLANDALAVIAELSRLLSAHVIATGDTGPWHSFVSSLIAACIGDVERAADSLNGRASARVLCAIASASHHALSTVLESAMPVISDLYEDATLHDRCAVRSSVLGLLAGLIHTINPRFDHPPGGHSLSKHTARVYDILTDTLAQSGPISGGGGGGYPSSSAGSGGGSARVWGGHAAAVAGTAAAAVAAAEPATRATSGGGGSTDDGVSSVGSRRDSESHAVASAVAAPTPSVISSAEKASIAERAQLSTVARCVAAAGLCDLAVRPPSSLLAPEQKTQITALFTSIFLRGDADTVREACLRALCTMASVRTRFCAAVVTTAVPQLLAVVREEFTAAPQGPQAVARRSGGGNRSLAPGGGAAASARSSSDASTFGCGTSSASPIAASQGEWVQEMYVTGQSASLSRALYALGQLCCISNLDAQHAIVPQLLEIAVEVLPVHPRAQRKGSVSSSTSDSGGASGAERGRYRLRGVPLTTPSSSSSSAAGADSATTAAGGYGGGYVISKAAIAVISTLSRVVGTKSLVEGDFASMDAFLVHSSASLRVWQEVSKRKGGAGWCSPSVVAGGGGAAHGGDGISPSSTLINDAGAAPTNGQQIALLQPHSGGDAAAHGYATALGIAVSAATSSAAPLDDGLARTADGELPPLLHEGAAEMSEEQQPSETASRAGAGAGSVADVSTSSSPYTDRDLEDGVTTTVEAHVDSALQSVHEQRQRGGLQGQRREMSTHSSSSGAGLDITGAAAVAASLREQQQQLHGYSSASRHAPPPSAGPATTLAHLHSPAPSFSQQQQQQSSASVAALSPSPQPLDDNSSPTALHLPPLLLPTLFFIAVDSVREAEGEEEEQEHALRGDAASATAAHEHAHEQQHFGHSGSSGGVPLPLRVRSAIELAFRTVSIRASTGVQDAFRGAITRVLLSLPPDHSAAAAAASSSVSTPAAASGGALSPSAVTAATPPPPNLAALEAGTWFRPLSPSAPLDQICLLPVFLKVLCCSRRGALVPFFSRIVPALAIAVFTMPAGDLLSCEDPQQRHRTRAILEMNAQASFAGGSSSGRPGEFSPLMEVGRGGGADAAGPSRPGGGNNNAPGAVGIVLADVDAVVAAAASAQPGGSAKQQQQAAGASSSSSSSIYGAPTSTTTSLLHSPSAASAAAAALNNPLVRLRLEVQRAAVLCSQTIGVLVNRAPLAPLSASPTAVPFGETPSSSADNAPAESLPSSSEPLTREAFAATLASLFKSIADHAGLGARALLGSDLLPGSSSSHASVLSAALAVVGSGSASLVAAGSQRSRGVASPLGGGGVAWSEVEGASPAVPRASTTTTTAPVLSASPSQPTQQQQQQQYGEPSPPMIPAALYGPPPSLFSPTAPPTAGPRAARNAHAVLNIRTPGGLLNPHSEPTTLDTAGSGSSSSSSRGGVGGHRKYSSTLSSSGRSDLAGEVMQAAIAAEAAAVRLLQRQQQLRHHRYHRHPQQQHGGGGVAAHGHQQMLHLDAAAAALSHGALLCGHAAGGASSSTAVRPVSHNSAAALCAHCHHVHALHARVHATQQQQGQCLAGAAAVLALDAATTAAPAPAAPARIPDCFICRTRERGVLLIVWLAKGLAMRAHSAAQRCIAALVHVVTGRDVELAHRVPLSQHLVTLAGQGLGIVVSDPPPRHPFSRYAGATESGVYKQKLFGVVFAQYSLLHDCSPEACSLPSSPDVLASSPRSSRSDSPLLDLTVTPDVDRLGAEGESSRGGGQQTQQAGRGEESGVAWPGVSGNTAATATDAPAGDAMQPRGGGGAPTGPSSPAGSGGGNNAAARPTSRLTARAGGKETTASMRQQRRASDAAAAAGGGDRQQQQQQRDGAESSESVVTHVRANAEPEAMVPLLLSLCAMAMQLPVAVLLADVDRVLPVVIRALEITSLGGALHAANAFTLTTKPVPSSKRKAVGVVVTRSSGSTAAAPLPTIASTGSLLTASEQHGSSSVTAGREAATTAADCAGGVCECCATDGSATAPAGPAQQSECECCAAAAAAHDPLLCFDHDAEEEVHSSSDGGAGGCDAGGAATAAAMSGALLQPHGVLSNANRDGPAELQFPELRDAVATSALFCLRVLITHAPAPVTAHLHTLVPILVTLACHDSSRPAKPIVRATAIDCLRGFVSLPFHKLFPVRNTLISGLVPALDDPKRAVRRRAAACRNDWATLSQSASASSKGGGNTGAL